MSDFRKLTEGVVDLRAVQPAGIVLEGTPWPVALQDRNPASTTHRRIRTSRRTDCGIPLLYCGWSLSSFKSARMLIDVGLRFRECRGSCLRAWRHSLRSGVVRSQRKRRVAVVAIEHLLQVFHSAVYVRFGVKRIADSEIGLRRGHQLHEPLSALRRYGAWFSTRLTLDERTDQLGVDSFALRRARYELVERIAGQRIAIALPLNC